MVWETFVSGFLTGMMVGAILMGIAWKAATTRK